MSQHAAGQKTSRKVHQLPLDGEGAAPAEHPAERNARLSELRKDGDHRRWMEKLEKCASLAFVLGLCAVWAVVLLSGRFLPEDKQLVSNLVVPVVTALGGYVAGTKRASNVDIDRHGVPR